MLHLPPSYRVVAYGAVGSTNIEAGKLARDGAADGTVVWAEEQTQGRGRSGRTWTSPPGNLYLSLILRPECAPAQAAQLSFLPALALGDALAELLPASAEIRFKWPNDVLLNGAKVAGILLEAEGTADARVRWVILGMGVNLRDHPPDTEMAATDVAAATGAAIEPAQLLEVLVGAIDRWRRRWEGDGFTPLREAWLARAKGLGEPIRVRLPRSTLHGRFAGLDGDGTLLLDTGEGAPVRIGAGDVFYATPASATG